MNKDFILEHLPEMQSFGINVLQAFCILIAGFYLAKFLKKHLKRLLMQRDEVLANFTAQLFFVVCLILTVITTLGTLGVQTTSILTVIGTAGVAIALALKDSLSSIAGGIILIVLRPFKKGDVVEINSIVGKVESINLFNTLIRLADEKLAILPNASIIKANIINSTNSDKRRIEWVCGVGYGSDIEVVRSTIKEVIASIEGIDQSISPFVGITDLGANSLNFTIRVWVNIESGIFHVKSQLIEKTKIALDAKAIEIPYSKLDITIQRHS